MPDPKPNPLPESVVGLAPGASSRSWARVAALSTALVLGGLFATAGNASAGIVSAGHVAAGDVWAGSAPPVSAFRVADLVGNVDVDAVVADLAGDRLAGVDAGSPEYAQMKAQIDRANSSSVDLHVVVLGVDVTGAEPKDVDAAILAAVGGTVILLSPDHIEIASQTISQSDLDEAQVAAQSGGGDVGAVKAFVDSVTATGFPWSLVVILLVMVLLVGAVAGGLWEKRRKQKRVEEALERLTNELAESVGALAPDILYISERISLVQDPELTERFNQSSSLYNEYRDRLAAGPLKSREEVDRVDVAVSKLRAELTNIRAAVDAGIPG